jgi:hypothetical protein
MKQNITLAMDKQLLKRARALAAEKGLSVSALLAAELQRVLERETAYRQASARALERLEKPLPLGAASYRREDLHDRPGLR